MEHPGRKKTPAKRAATAKKNPQSAAEFDPRWLEEINSPSGMDEVLVTLHRSMRRGEDQSSKKVESLSKLMLRWAPDPKVIATKKRLAKALKREAVLEDEFDALREDERDAVREDEECWGSILSRLVSIDGEYQVYVTALRGYEAESKDIIRQCQKLATAIETASCAKKLYPLVAVEKAGVKLSMKLISSIGDSDLTLVLLHYRNLTSTPSPLLDNVMTRMLYGANPFGYLPDLLTEFSSLLSAGEFNRNVREVRSAIPRKSASKLEFYKRRAFQILAEEIQKRADNSPEGARRKIRNPNKETALVVNTLLRLSGKDAVTPNDISQMNKTNRRKYWVE